jgi:two-component system KDP operon response regulator KdpE
LKPDPTALIIDTDRGARRLLRAVLEPQGYRVSEAEDGETGLKKAVECKPDVIILEMDLPNQGGPGFLQILREWSRTPVLVLSERADDETKVAALDAGASDYLTKPFSSAEMLARLRVLRRPLPNVPDGPLLIEGELVANVATHQISLNGRTVRLTPKEEALFYVLARYAGKVVTNTHLFRAVWGVHSEQRIHDLRVLVGHLRKKLGSHGGEMVIRTEGSIGYCLLLSTQRPPASSLVSSRDAKPHVMVLRTTPK